MKRKAYAKVNLALDVTGKRMDGYHELDMIMQSIDLYDEIELTLSDKQGIRLTCNLDYVPIDERNIAYRAAQRFLKGIHSTKGVDIHIEKNIPVAAGLAGGSTDGAAALRLLNEAYDFPMSEEELLAIGLSLGADVPFTMVGGTKRCQGIGEVMTPVASFEGRYLVLAKPQFGLSTAEIFKDLKIELLHRHPRIDDLISAITRGDTPMVARQMGNVLENVSFKKAGNLRTLKQKLLKVGALGAAMSGSGPTIFGLFASKEEALGAMARLDKERVQLFCCQTIDPSHTDFT